MTFEDFKQDDHRLCDGCEFIERCNEPHGEVTIFCTCTDEDDCPAWEEYLEECDE